MNAFNVRNWKTAFLLSIIIPVGLLVTFRLTGIMKGPITPEDILLLPVSWEYSRPSKFTNIDKELNAIYADNGCLIRLGVIIGIYIEDSKVRYGADYIGVKVGMNSTTAPHVRVTEAKVLFCNDSQPSLVDWIRSYITVENLSLLSVYDGWTSENGITVASILFGNLNGTNQVAFSATVEWSLLTSNNKTHQAEIVFQVTYFDGAVYRKVAQIFNLEITGNNL